MTGVYAGGTLRDTTTAHTHAEKLRQSPAELVLALEARRRELVRQRKELQARLDGESESGGAAGRRGLGVWSR